MKKFFFLLAGFTVFASQAQQSTTDTTRRFLPPPIGTITPTRQNPVHDPCNDKRKEHVLFILHRQWYFSILYHIDMKDWRKERAVFAKTPDWVTKSDPQFQREQHVGAGYQLL